MSKKEENKSTITKLLGNRILRTIVAIVVVGGLFVALLLYGLKIYTKHGESVAVPSVQGLQVEEAAGILNKASLRYEVVDSIFLTDGTPGAIIEQIPEEGSSVKKDRVVYLKTQAKSVEMVTIPALKDFSQRQAVATLKSLGFANITINEVSSAYKGLVLDITSSGKTIGLSTKIAKGSPIVLTVGAGGEVLIDSLIDFMPDVESQELDFYEEVPATDNSFFE